MLLVLYEYSVFIRILLLLLDRGVIAIQLLPTSHFLLLVHLGDLFEVLRVVLVLHLTLLLLLLLMHHLIDVDAFDVYALLHNGRQEFHQFVLPLFHLLYTSLLVFILFRDDSAFLL